MTARISSFCSGGDCVEVDDQPDGTVAVRDTKDRSHEHHFAAQDWSAFLTGVKHGEFSL